MLIGVDIGTQGTKTALYSNDGTLVAQATEPSELSRPARGIVEEDPDRQVASVCRTIRACMEKSGQGPADIDGVAIDGQMAGLLGVDASGNAITPYDSWLDTRCAPQIEQMKSRAAREITESTGCAPSFNHGPKILWWRDEHPDVFARIASFVQPGSYAAMKLCGIQGADAFIDRTYLHFSGFADNAAGVWSEPLCNEFRIPLDKLPRIVSSSDIVGTITEEMADQAGLAAGTPVAAGCGDTAASFLSCGATREGVCVDVAGTASVFAATTSEFRADSARMVLGCGQAVTPGLWHPYAYINGGGLNLEWFSRLAFDLSPATGPAELEDLNALADSGIDPSAQPLFIPHFAGRVTPPMPQLRGAWVGLDWSHGVGALYRSMLESVAFEYSVYKNTLREIYPEFKPTELRVTGGGEKSSLWNRIKASVLDLRVISIEGGGGAPMGSAMLAGWATGIFTDPDEAGRHWVRTGSGCEPDPALRKGYRRNAGRYAALIDLLNSFAEERDDEGEPDA